jgi:hypothetical protein
MDPRWFQVYQKNLYWFSLSNYCISDNPDNAQIRN